MTSLTCQSMKLGLFLPQSPLARVAATTCPEARVHVRGIVLNRGKSLAARDEAQGGGINGRS